MKSGKAGRSKVSLAGASEASVGERDTGRTWAPRRKHAVEILSALSYSGLLVPIPIKGLLDNTRDQLMPQEVQLAIRLTFPQCLVRQPSQEPGYPVLIRHAQSGPFLDQDILAAGGPSETSVRKDLSLHLRCMRCLRDTRGPPFQLRDLAKPLKEVDEKHPSCLCLHHRSTEKSTLPLIETRRKEHRGAWFKLSEWPCFLYL